MQLRFQLFGEPSVKVENGAQREVGLSARKGLALLAYLAMQGGRPVPRVQLADLLWGHRVDRQARQNLRQCLMMLRRDLGPDLADVLLVTDQSLALRCGAFKVDVLQFEAWANDPNPAVRVRCLDIPWAPPFQGFTAAAEAFDDWAVAERERHTTIAVRTFADLSVRLDNEADGERAIAAMERLVRIDSSEENWHRRLLLLEAKHRGVDAAVARGKTLAAELKREIDVDPEPATLTLIQEIRSRGAQLPEPEPMRPPVRSPSVAEAPSGPLLPNRTPRPHRWLQRPMLIAIGLICLLGVGFLLQNRSAALLHANDPTKVDPATIVSSPAAERPPVSWQSPHLLPVRNSTPESAVTPIIVLPFKAYGESESPIHLKAEILTDDLINLLSRVPSLRVISRQTSISYKDVPIDAARVGAELGVRYLVEGSVQLRNGKLRANIQLVDAASGLQVWSGRVERDNADHHTIQDEIIVSLARELQVATIQAEGAGSEKPHVHELTFKGWAALYDAAKSGESALRKAENYFSEALEQDPANTRAQIGLGAYHVNMAVQLFAPDPAPHLAKAEDLLQPIIERLPNISEPHAFMGVVHLMHGKLDDAARSLDRSIEINPSGAQVYAQLGRVLLRMGRPEEGLQHILYAMRLSPRDPLIAYWLGFAGASELELKHYGQAIEYLDRAAALNPRQPRTMLVLAAAHALNGDMSEGRRKFEQLRVTLPHLSGEKVMERFFGAGAGSRQPQLREGLRLLIEPPPDPWQSPGARSKPPSNSAQIGKGITSLVVLPFKTYGETSDAISLLADMMTDDVINMLSRMQSFRVISRQTARSYGGQPIDVATLGAELRVRYVMEGSLRMQGDTLRVTVELIDPATRLVVWSGRIERNGADRYGVQDEIVARLARELQFEMLPIEGRRLAKDQDADALAYRGWAAMSAAYSQSSKDAFNRAHLLFTQALERDTEHVSAQLGLGAYHANVGAQVLDAESTAHLEKARDILQELISRRPTDSRAQHYMGLVHGARGNLPGALESFERSVQLNPSNAGAHAHIGHALSRMGRPAEGLEHLRYAIRLSPRDPNLAYWLEFVGCAELELDRVQSAIENFRRSTALNPGYPRSWAGLVAAHALSGNAIELRQSLERLKTLTPSLTNQDIVRRFGRREGQAPRLREGLRVAVASGH
jgi:TolB-like protein/DNA-binding SARP family transcriptional activator/Tfp pilus assembly protein PilF